MTTTKPYDDYNRVIQINAISSWLRLNVDKIVIINSSDSDNRKYFNANNVNVVPFKRQSSMGVPYVKDVFESGYGDYKNGDVLCYINADMILHDDFVFSINSIPTETYDNFLIGGRRWSWKDKNAFLSIQSFPMDLENVKSNGSLDPSCATDYFVHNKELYENIIPSDMMIARCNWDMWLNATAMERGKTIDITNTCFAIHPHHGYGNRKMGWEQYAATIEEELKVNRKYERGLANIDAYRYYTAIKDGKVVINGR